MRAVFSQLALLDSHIPSHVSVLRTGHQIMAMTFSDQNQSEPNQRHAVTSDGKEEEEEEEETTPRSHTQFFPLSLPEKTEKVAGLSPGGEVRAVTIKLQY